RPDASVVLNVTQDHLDWHGSMQAYAGAKARLLAAANIAIVNRDDPLVLDMVDSLASPRVRSFGRGLPEYAGDVGLEDSGGIEWLCAVALPEEASETGAARRKNKEAPQRHTGTAQRLMPVDALRLRGRHNALNALAALTLVQSIGGALAPMLHALREYQGEPHRCQFLRSVGGVDFVNDSKGTNVGATVAALEGMGRPVVLIAGGLGKGQDFTPLAQAIELHAKAVVLIGKDAPLIRAALGQPGKRRWMPPWVWPARAVLCCCRRLAPAWTCSRITGSAVTALPRRWTNSHLTGGTWHEPVLQSRWCRQCQGRAHRHAPVRRHAHRGLHLAGAVRPADGVFGLHRVGRRAP